MKDISKRIKELRMERNLTQDDLAEQLHVTRQTVSSWETKKTRPDVETLEAIAQAFGIDITELLYRKQKEHRFEGVRFNGPSDPKMVKQAKIFGIIFVVGFLFRYIYPLILQGVNLMGLSFLASTSNVLLVIAFILISNWSFAFLGPFVLALISIKNDVSIKNETRRKRVFVIGMIFAGLAMFSWPLWITCIQFELLDYLPMHLGNIFALLVFMVFQNHYVLAAIASLIWLGKKVPREDKAES